VKVGDRVIWMKYGYTGYIDKTGFGTVLEIVEKPEPLIIILRDDGQIRNFDSSMIKPYEDWDE